MLMSEIPDIMHTTLATMLWSASLYCKELV